MLRFSYKFLNKRSSCLPFIKWRFYSMYGTTVALISTATFASTSFSENKYTESTNSCLESFDVYQKLIAELLVFLRPNQLDYDIEECKQRGKPLNSYHRSDNYPQLIIYPYSTEQVSLIVKLCRNLAIPIIPYGGGTSLEGQTLSPCGGVSMDFSFMKKIIKLNEDDLDVQVQSGLGYIELNEALKSKGLWFPLDPGPGATIGGMCACRCSGSTAVRYGSMRENVLNLTAVLPDGNIIHTGSRARKSSAGYDITRLLIGSEGTLGIITEATLKLHCIPKVSHAIRIAFPGINGIHNAASTAKETINSGVAVGRCELLDESMVKIINLANTSATAAGVNRNNSWPEHTTLLYELTGVSEEAVAEQLDIVLSIALHNGAGSSSGVSRDSSSKEPLVEVVSRSSSRGVLTSDAYKGAMEPTMIHIATTKEETACIWRQRKEALWSAISQYPDREVMITDVCVPLSQLPVLITEVKEVIVSMDPPLPCPIIAHAGDGNFHVFIFFKPEDVGEVVASQNLAKQMATRAILLGGTCTGEHGIGIGKKELLSQEMGQGTMALMKKIKVCIDPENIMNPGKVIDVE